MFKKFMDEIYPTLKECPAYVALENVLGKGRYNWTAVFMELDEGHCTLSKALSIYTQVVDSWMCNDCDKSLLSEFRDLVDDLLQADDMYLSKYILADVALTVDSFDIVGMDPEDTMERLSDMGFPPAGLAHSLILYHDYEVARYLGDDSEDPNIILSKMMGLLRKVADVGYAPAQMQLATLMLRHPEFMREEGEHTRYMISAAEQGNPEAMVCLGDWYGSLPNEEGALEKAVKYLEDAQNANWYCSDFNDLIRSKNLLWKARKVLNKSSDIGWELPLLEELAEYGDSEALFQLGKMYFHGDGVEQSFEKAMEYMDDIDNREPESYLYRGIMYYCGQGVEQSFESAFDDFKTAAFYNVPEAYFYLGMSYLGGNGTLFSPKDAEEWFWRYAGSGRMSIKLDME